MPTRARQLKLVARDRAEEISAQVVLAVLNTGRAEFTLWGEPTVFDAQSNAQHAKYRTHILRLAERVNTIMTVTDLRQAWKAHLIEDGDIDRATSWFGRFAIEVLRHGPHSCLTRCSNDDCVEPWFIARDDRQIYCSPACHYSRQPDSVRGRVRRHRQSHSRL